MPDNNEPISTGSSTDLNSFIEEVKKPTTPALGGPAPFDGPIKYNIPPPPPGPAPDAPPVNPDEPLFKENDLEPDELEEEPGESDKGRKPAILSEEYKKKTLRTYLRMEEKGSAWLFAKMAGTDDKSPFMYDEESREWLLISLEPYMDTIIEKVPAWIPLLLVYGGMKFDQATKAFTINKTNKANAAGRADAGKMGAVAATAGSTIERKNYMLYIDGYYKVDRRGDYIKDRKGEGKPKLEKPSMDDLQKILAVPANNEVDLLCAAFDCKQSDFARLGITINKD